LLSVISLSFGKDTHSFYCVHVRLWHLADINSRVPDVRSWGNNGH
jgi:hypothetical protein